jgi:hypothetical protein
VSDHDRVHETTTTNTAAPGEADARRLLDLLNDELVVQHRLLALATQMREAIIERQVETLTALGARHQALVEEAERRAFERLAVSREIAGGAGLPAEHLTLTALAGVCPDALADEFAATRALMVEVTTAVRNAHHLNRELLENELNYIGASIEVLARAAAPRRDYRTPLAGQQAPALLLDKAA